MRKLFCVLSCLLWCWSFWYAAPPAQAAAGDKTSIVAVILLGSLEYQQRDYYEIVAENLSKRFYEPNNKIIIGEHPQQMFNRYSDKQGLVPGAIPSEEELINFAWTHSFDRVLFLLTTAPSIQSDGISILGENATVTINARAIAIESRKRLKLSDDSTIQTVRVYNRNAAKKAVFQKALEILCDRITLSQV